MKAVNGDAGNLVDYDIMVWCCPHQQPAVCVLSLLLSVIVGNRDYSYYWVIITLYTW